MSEQHQINKILKKGSRRWGVVHCKRSLWFKNHQKMSSADTSIERPNLRFFQRNTSKTARQTESCRYVPLITSCEPEVYHLGILRIHYLITSSERCYLLEIHCIHKFVGSRERGSYIFIIQVVNGCGALAAMSQWVPVNLGIAFFLIGVEQWPFYINDNPLRYPKCYQSSK